MKCTGFDLIVGELPKVMILGTMPSVQSLASDFYYAHPRNAFWPMMASIFNHAVESREDKVTLIKQSDCLLWDVLSDCERQGSLDSAIKQAKANNFEAIFKRYPEIKTVLFNGQTAAQLFKRHVIKHQIIPADIQFYTLPSTSPANARLTFEEKRLKWQEVVKQKIWKFG